MRKLIESYNNGYGPGNGGNGNLPAAVTMAGTVITVTEATAMVHRSAPAS